MIILDNALFINGHCFLAFRGRHCLIGNHNNGNFLGILELITHHYVILEEHLQKREDSKFIKTRLQVHNLFSENKNAFNKCYPQGNIKK